MSGTTYHSSVGNAGLKECSRFFPKISALEGKRPSSLLLFKKGESHHTCQLWYHKKQIIHAAMINPEKKQNGCWSDPQRWWRMLQQCCGSWQQLLLMRESEVIRLPCCLSGWGWEGMGIKKKGGDWLQIECQPVRKEKKELGINERGEKIQIVPHFWKLRVFFLK